MSDTPRTDAIVQECLDDDECMLTDPNFQYMVAHARELERELAQAEAENAALRKHAANRDARIKQLETGYDLLKAQAGKLKSKAANLEVANKALEHLAKHKAVVNIDAAIGKP